MRLPAAILSGVAVAVLAALALATPGHHGLSGIHGWLAPLSLLLGACASTLVFNMVPANPAAPPRNVFEWLVIGIFFCASARAFLWLFYAEGDQWKILSPNNLGDISLHLTLIRWMAAAQHWWPSSPILAGDPLRYPVGSDLFNALLLVVGVPVNTGLIWCGLAGAALTGFALWRWGKGMAVAAFLFNGGMAGIVLLKGGDPDAVSQWKNLFLALFVTQRGFLVALPVALLLLSAWRDENFRSPGTISLPLPIQVLLLGMTPLFSIHTALYLGVAMIGVAVAAPAGRKRFGVLALWSWPAMAFLGWLVATGAGGPSALGSIGWKPGWMSDGTLHFWWWNFGVSLPLSLLLTLVLIRRTGSREARAFVWPAAVVFLCCMMIRFAPWPWDNMKLMLWSWIVIAPYLWSELLENRPLMIRVLAVLALFGSGVPTLIAGLDGRHGYELVRRSELNETSWILKNVPKESVIACSPEFNHPVLLLGHPVVCGYEGHLWSHGLDYHTRLDALESIMNGEEGWRQKAAELGVSDIYWGERERIRWPDSRLPWAKETVSSLHQLGPCPN